ncbi:vanadium-dependent haloperoxidase [Hymenobacter crusticola]|uniref:Phosphatidic acid phosphatase type 2/haloperoxidase domain-containing protein n=1 Tax=Hymenobacter crusticola TaxID=1770526 RepID=A0A243W8A1_9BACT|nr:vanadium-dependent haloperoxidase [Hymenobacter crusticola]OUJ69196.1 hypothetical protein BXP70_26780 [Hymenobacter crusticola]
MATRAERAKQARDSATDHQTINRPAYEVPWGTTPDEQGSAAFPAYAASFHKLLEHDATTGQLTPSGIASYNHLLAGLGATTASSDDFDHDEMNLIQLANGGSGQRVLINPRTSKAFSTTGGDIVSYDVAAISQYGTKAQMLAALSLHSASTAAEIVELYAMAVLRDVPFDEYTKPVHQPLVQLALDALNAFGADFKGPKQGLINKVNAGTLFRGNSPGDLRGGYLSKFLLLKRPPLFPSGCAPHVASLIHAEIFFNDFAENLTVPNPNKDREFGLTWNHYVGIQNGLIPDPYKTGDFTKPTVVVTNGRHLGTLVHLDTLYEEFAWALDILTAGAYARNPSSPYSTPASPTAYHAKNEGDGPTLGIPNAAGLLGAVALEAIRAAWTQKWLVARRARPEPMGALVHQRRNGGTEATHGALDARLLDRTAHNAAVSALLNKVKSENKRRGGNVPAAETYLLPQLFPEGSPAHPAWPSGHATVSGACVTVLKAIFNSKLPLLQQTTNYPPFLASDGNPLTIAGELDKLASNVALGRNFGGVHYRSDGEDGILLGEEVAIRFLQDHLRTYQEQLRKDGMFPAEIPGPSTAPTVPHFTLPRRNGQMIRITPTGVTTLLIPVVSSLTAADPTLLTADIVIPAGSGESTSSLAEQVTYDRAVL